MNLCIKCDTNNTSSTCRLQLTKVSDDLDRYPSLQIIFFSKQVIRQSRDDANWTKSVQLDNFFTMEFFKGSAWCQKLINAICVSKREFKIFYFT